MPGSNGHPECCRQCAFKHARHAQYCGYMGNAHEYFVLDCEVCGKTIVDQQGNCVAANCTEKHGGRWHLKFAKKGVLLGVYDPLTDQSLIDKTDART